MTRVLRTSEAGLELIKSFEGFRARAVGRPGGGWTIGYSHTRSARAGLRVSEADAATILQSHDLPPVEAAIVDAVLAPLNQNQFDALASFAFNIGIEAFQRSDVLARLNAGDPLGAADAMADWRHARIDGRLVVVDALVRRRAVEQAVFLEPVEGRLAAASSLIKPECKPERERAPDVGARPAAPGSPAAAQPDIGETAPEAAARAVAARLTRILAETPPPPVDTASETQDSPGPSAPAAGLVDDLEPVNLASAEVERAMTPQNDRLPAPPPAALGWAALAALALCGVALSAIGTANVLRADRTAAVANGLAQVFSGPLLIAVGSLTAVIGVYYLLRAIYSDAD